MFKNPLKKYAAGGVTNAQKQELVQVFSKAASKLQIEPEVLIQKAQELTGEEQVGFMQAIQDVADNNQPKPESLQFIQNVFRKSGQSSQAFKDGGKIHDFICKHARGGHAADCGCKQEGGNVEVPENKRGYTASADRFKKDGSVAALDEKANGVTRTTLFPGTSNEWSYFTDYTGYPSVTYEPRNQIEWGRGLGDFITYVPDQKWRWMNNQMDVARKYGTPDYRENGGKVLKGQHGLSSGRFDIPFGAYMKAYFNKRSTPNVGAATNRSFGYSTSNGNEYYLEDANVGRSSVDTWVNVTPQKDTIIMQKLPSDHINDLEDYQMEAIMQRMRPDIKRVNNHENGGKVEKAQRGKKVNNNRKTITEVGHGLDEYDAKEMGIDPNTLAGTSSIITAYPNKKPYVVNGQIPFWTRNGLVFNLGGVESDYIEDGVRMGKGVPGRKYKVSSVLDQDGLLNFGYNENAKEFPMISRYASPKDTIYYLDFNDFDKNTLGYEEVRSMYNKAIDQPDTFALNKEAYLELQRQKQERAPKK